MGRTAVTACFSIRVLVACACAAACGSSGDKSGRGDAGGSSLVNMNAGGPNSGSAGHGASSITDAGVAAVADGGTKTRDGWNVFFAIDPKEYSVGGADLPPKGEFGGLLATRTGAVLGWNWYDPPDYTDPGIAASGIMFVDGALVWRSTDNGGHWIPVTPDRWTSGGPTEAHSVGFVREPSTGALYGWYGGVIRSQDDGNTWSLVSPASLTDVRQLFVRDVHTLFVLHHPAADDAGAAVSMLSRSDDGGATFTLVATDVPDGVLVIDKYDTLHVFSETTLWRRFPHDSHWYASTRPVGGSGNGVYDAFALPDGTLLLSEDQGVSRSVDYGDSWTLVSGSPGRLEQWTLESDKRLYARDPSHVYVSGDLGATWKSIGPVQGGGAEQLGAFSLLPSGQVLVAAAALGGEMFLSPTVDVALGKALAGPAARPATCYDGVQNGNESAVDCGGSCRLCGS